MSDKSAIEWTDATWNPTTGCTKISPACANCYIERTIPFRSQGRRFVNGHIPIQFHENRLEQPLKWKAPRRVFVNSLSDLFHDDIPDEFISRVFATMALAPQHRFQVLTKRAQRMRDYITEMSADPDAYCFAWAREMEDAPPLRSEQWPLPNVWLGVSVENQHFADERIPLLLQTQAAVRFLSCEPLLESVTFRWAKWDDWKDDNGKDRPEVNELDGLRMLDWVIVGGESGPRLRPTKPEWIRTIRDQCNAAGVPFFFKQWGGRVAKAGGRVLDGRTWDEMPVAAGEDRA